MGWHVTGSERTRIGRAAVVIAALVSGMTASSCGEFTHNNPFDPAVPVTLTIHGPDSAFSQFDTLRFTVTTDPVYDYDDVEWLISGLQKIDNNGTYQVGPIQTYSGQPTRVAVSVRIGSRTASKDVNVVFKPAGSLASFCRSLPGNTFLLDTARSKALDWIGKTQEVCTNVVDAHGGIISTSRQLSSSARSLDTTVAQITPGSATIVAAGNGTTGIVLTNGTRVDTLVITVRQVVTSLTVTPAACVPSSGVSMAMTLGDNLQLTLGAPAYDLGRTQVTDPAIIQQAVAAATWAALPFQGAVPIGVTTDGLVTATTRGYAWVGATLSGTLVATCSIQVQ